MPRLVKGGKFVYGLSRIGPDGVIIIPLEAMKEYKYAEGDKVIVLSGSRKSGGFGLTTKSILEKSELHALIEKIPGLVTFQIPEGEIIEGPGRLFCWTVIGNGGRVRIPLQSLSRFGVKPGGLLTVGRGSYLAIAFIARGPVFKEALRHSELEVFED